MAGIINNARRANDEESNINLCQVISILMAAHFMVMTQQQKRDYETPSQMTFAAVASGKKKKEREKRERDDNINSIFFPVKRSPSEILLS